MQKSEIVFNSLVVLILIAICGVVYFLFATEEVEIEKLETEQIVIAFGETYHIEVAHGKNYNDYIYENSNSKVAIIDIKSGVIEAIGYGKTNVEVIDAETRKVYRKLELIVEKKDDDKLVLDTLIQVSVGETKKIKVNSEKKLTWSINNSKIATVSDGIVTGKSVGETLIIVSDGTKRITIKVKVVLNHNIAIKLSKTTLDIMVGQKDILVATVDFKNTDKFVWSSSNTDVVTVNQEGQIKAIKAGSATITVRLNSIDKSASCKIIVKEKTTQVVVADVTTIITNKTINPTSWSGVDDIGRTVPTKGEIYLNSAKVGSKNGNKVGIWYWPWHYSHQANCCGYTQNRRGINLSKLLAVDGNTFTSASYNSSYWAKHKANHYWWNEPIYGFYTEYDSYVIRRQVELLADAQIDFIVIDATNGTLSWVSEVREILKVWSTASKDGVNVPKIVFNLPFDAGSNTNVIFEDIYNNLYLNYKNFFFKFGDKPLIIGHKSSVVSKTKAEEFIWRDPVATYNKDGEIKYKSGNIGWGWLSSYPQAIYLGPAGNAEMTTVGVSMNSRYTTRELVAMNAGKVMGRSYAANDYSYAYKYQNRKIVVNSSISKSSLYGRNFQQQWDYAINHNNNIKSIPNIIVVGWNEWFAGRYNNFMGAENAFPDQYIDEYSRDIEPSKGELKDNYYYQLVSNVRLYKGANEVPIQPKAKTIKKLSDWLDSSIVSYNTYRNSYLERNGKEWGYENKNFYKTNDNTKVRNDIVTAKVSYDSENIYFVVETANKITKGDGFKFMRLFIDIDDEKTNSSNNWSEFEFVLNRERLVSDSKMVLEKSSGNWNWIKVGDVDYLISGKILHVVIPRDYLGLTENKIKFNFKWADNNMTNINGSTADYMSVYTDGDTAPGGRFTFCFNN